MSLNQYRFRTSKTSIAVGSAATHLYMAATLAITFERVVSPLRYSARSDRTVCVSGVTAACGVVN